MTNSLITVAIPTVNYTYLKEAIESVVNQTYENIEIIILNNAKTDNDKSKIKDICIKFKDKRIRYFENDFQIPMVKNWNTAFLRANGVFFAILCDDDKWHPDFLNEMITLAVKFPTINLFHSRIIKIDEKGKEFCLSQLCPEYEDGLNFIYHRISGYRSTYLSDFMVKTSVLQSIGGFTEFPDGWGSDDITWFKIAINGGVAYSPKPLFYYRESLLNISNNNAIENKLIAIDCQYEEIQKIILPHTNNNELIIDMIKQQLVIFKDSKKYPFWEKKLKLSYGLPTSLVKLIASIKRYYVRKQQLKLYNSNIPNI